MLGGPVHFFLYTVTAGTLDGGAALCAGMDASLGLSGSQVRRLVVHLPAKEMLQSLELHENDFHELQ